MVAVVRPTITSTFRFSQSSYPMGSIVACSITPLLRFTDADQASETGKHPIARACPHSTAAHSYLYGSTYAKNASPPT